MIKYGAEKIRSGRKARDHRPSFEHAEIRQMQRHEAATARAQAREGKAEGHGEKRLDHVRGNDGLPTFDHREAPPLCEKTPCRARARPPRHA